jgi:hypothetical protein
VEKERAAPMMDIYTIEMEAQKNGSKGGRIHAGVFPGIGASVDLRPSLHCLGRLLYWSLVLSLNMLGEGRQGDCGEEAEPWHMPGGDTCKRRLYSISYVP